MAAALRHAARTLVGVQRAQAAAVAEERRRLLHTDERERMLRQIQEKKEQLYDLIAVTENNVHTDPENRLLLRCLAVQIEPRPHDPQWCWMRASNRRHAVLKPAGVATGLIISVVCWFMLREMGDFRARPLGRPL